MTPEELHEVLTGLIGKPLKSAAAIPEMGVLMLCFPDGKTLYITGVLDYELEAAS